MDLETLKELEHDFEYTGRGQEVIEDELIDELEELLEDHSREHIMKEISHLESDEFRDLARNTLDEI